MYFRNLILSAFSIALIAGLLLSVYQYFFITPIILASEVYEVLEPTTGGMEAWSPEDGAGRSGFNFIANVLVCFGYGLLLMSAMATRIKITPLHGFFWGIAAYLSLFVMPALGLPPEIPGMEAAFLEGRQIWWLLTVIFTALGLWSIAFQTRFLKAVGVLMLITPHLIGAPQPEIHGFLNTNPQAKMALSDLWHQFILQTSVANGLLWLIIGVLSAFLTAKFIHSIQETE